MIDLDLPPDVIAKIEACEKIVEDDLQRIQDSIDGLEAIPEETFDDPSLVQHVDDLRSTAKQVTRSAERVRRLSDSPVVVRAKGA